MPALPPTAPPPLHHPPNPWRLRLGNLWWEARLSVRTRGVIDVQHSDAYHYATMSYRTIFQVLDHLQLGPHDSFVDIGCGKGRVLCCAARQSLRRVVGVDLSAELVQQARANAQSLRGRRSAVEVHQGLAQDFDYCGISACLMFNPFGADTLDAVLSAMARSRQVRTPASPLRVAYANPLHDAVFLQHPWLAFESRWTPQSHGVEHAVSFYRSH